VSEPDYGVRPCCVPDCATTLPRNRELPVCRDCGIKIALAHMRDAERFDAVSVERARRWKDLCAGRTDTSCVYYVRLDADRIKIGYTSNLRSRMSGLRVDLDALLAFEPGGRERERQRHQDFAVERIRADREDFAPSRRLNAWIADLRRENGLPRWATLPDTRKVTRR